MNKTIKTAGVRVTSGVKAGGLHSINHSRGALKVRTAVKAGGISSNPHARRSEGRTAVKAGGLKVKNHSRRLATIA